MMARHRIVTSLVAIAFAAPLTYLGINSVNSLGVSESGVFSRDRILADKFLEDENWLQAIFHLKKVLEKDPLNGHALNCQTYCLKVMRYDLRSQLKQLESGSDSRTRLEQRISDLENELIESLKKQATFLRFRSRSLGDLAIVLTAHNEWEAAMDCLEAYLDGGNLQRDFALSELSGLGFGGRELVDINEQELKDRYPDLELSKVGLHRFARFWKLVDRESKLRDENGLLRSLPFHRQ